MVTVTRKLGSVCPTIICNCKSPKALKISFFGEVGGVLALKCLSEENLTGNDVSLFIDCLYPTQCEYSYILLRECFCV